ncbi:MULTISPECIES: hypothetical protein [Caldanaerobacter]|nr:MULTISPECIES: hypothetical protein [Caldanaerobacter]
MRIKFMFYEIDGVFYDKEKLSEFVKEYEHSCNKLKWHLQK